MSLFAARLLRTFTATHLGNESSAQGAFAAFHSNLIGRSRFGEDSAAGPRSHCAA